MASKIRLEECSKLIEEVIGIEPVVDVGFLECYFCSMPLETEGHTDDCWITRAKNLIGG